MEDSKQFEKERIKALQGERDEIQTKTFTKWVNSFLQKIGLHIENLFTDLADGKMLIKLLEIISGEKLRKPNRGILRVQKIENCNISLYFLHDKIYIENIGAEDIVDGNQTLILGLIWTLILRFQIQEIEIESDEESSEKRSAKDNLLLWCQRKTAGYSGVDIKNFTSSWRNGLGFNALIHAFRPDLIDFDKLDPGEHIQNLNNAFHIASVELGITAILDAEDIDRDGQDEKIIMTYVSAYYHYFSKMTPKPDEDVFADIPNEIKGPKAIKIFRQGLDRGKIRVYHIRIMIVGHCGVGKSTITNVLLKDVENLKNLTSTDGIEIYIGRCHIDLDTEEWEELDMDDSELARLSERILRMLYEERHKELSESSKLTKDRTPLPSSDNVESEPRLESNESADNIALESENVEQASENIEQSTSSSDIQSNPEQESNKATDSTSPATESLEQSVISSSDAIQSAPIQESNETAANISTNQKAELMPTSEKMLSISNRVMTDFAKKYCEVEIWDFGGQGVFYTTHQAFLSPRCIYPLVIDVSREMEEKVKDDELIPGYESSMTVEEYVSFWVNIIVNYAGGKIPGFPKILPVLTHLDMIPVEEREETVSRIFKKMRRLFSDQRFKDHILYNHALCLNARDPSEQAYGFLKQEILKIAKTYPSWGEEIPASWLPFEYALYSMKVAGEKIIRFEDLPSLINENKEFPSVEKEEYCLFLDFHHNQGTIVYYNDKGLRDFIILHPKWLIGALRSIITADIFYEKDESKRKIFEGLSRRGVISHDFIDTLWNTKEYMEFYKSKKHVLQTMEKLDLLAPSFTYNDEGEVIKQPLYFVPSMVKEKIDTQLLYKAVPLKGTSCLLYTFQGNFLPKGVFNRLVASCLNLWPVEMHGDRAVLCAGFCCLRVDDCHTMAIRMRRYQILFSVTHVSHEKRNISSSLWLGLRHFVAEELKRICRMHREINIVDEKEENYSEKFIIHIPCCIQHLDCVTELDETRHDATITCEHHKATERLLEEIFMPQTVPEKSQEDDSVKCTTDCRGLKEPLRNETINEIELARVARRITAVPELFAAAFNMSSKPQWAEIQQDRNNGIFQHKFLMLLAWWHQTGNVTFGMLENELKDFGDDDMTIVHILCVTTKVNERYQSNVASENIPVAITTAQPQNSSEEQLYRVLQRANLLQYYDSFIAQGGDDVQQLYEADEEEFSEIMKLVGMVKPLHVRRLQKALKQWGLEQDTHVQESEPADTESALSDVVSKYLFSNITTKILNELADRMHVFEAYQLCIELGVSSSRLDEIRHDYVASSEMQKRKGLLTWKNSLKQHETPIKTLSVALCEVGVGLVGLKEVLKQLSSD